MHVGHDTSSASPGWSLLPSTVIIVLVLVNSVGSSAGTSSISMRLGSAALLPVSTASTGLLHLSVGTHVHHVRSDTELSIWPLPCAHHLQCMTHTYFLPDKNNRCLYRLSFGGGLTMCPDLVVTTAPLTSLAGLATLGWDSTTVLAYDLQGLRALGGWDTVKESVFGGLVMVEVSALGVTAGRETGMADIGQR